MAPLTAWPPPTAPSWPPPDYSVLEASTVDEALRTITDLGWTWRNPTNAENTQYFNAVRCQQNHRVDGVMIQDTRPGGLAYPFARCRGTEHEGLVLWNPFTVGYLG